MANFHDGSVWSLVHLVRHEKTRRNLIPAISGDSSGYIRGHALLSVSAGSPITGLDSRTAWAQEASLLGERSAIHPAS
jgi:hypothetical protein